MIKGPIQEEDITLINIYVPSIGELKYIKHILKDIKVETDNNTIIIDNFNMIGHPRLYCGSMQLAR